MIHIAASHIDTGQGESAAPSWSSIPRLNSCTDRWMLFAGDGYCRYERERIKVECDCVKHKKGATPTM
ncbi:hypothetical protein LA080_014971 [Diaporthe eres]|nr:hypothetical protein LA080_014971 [Diaporthe eres]